jgi:xylulokinase
VFQLPVATVRGNKEGGAYGACLVAGVGAGIWKNLGEACGMLVEETHDEPAAANKAVYDEMYGIYEGMVPALKAQFDKLAGAE